MSATGGDPAGGEFGGAEFGEAEFGDGDDEVFDGEAADDGGAPDEAAGASRPAPGAPAGGRLLVATPQLTDPHFSRSVVYLLEHDGGGTVGVIVNRPSHTPVGQVLPDWHDAMSGPQVVFGGGPVQPDGALCLARVPHPAGSGVRLLVGAVASVDLDGDPGEISSRASHLRVFAGHAGWSPGQLEAELTERAWWVVDGTEDDLFSADPRTLWPRVLRRQPAPLSLFATYPAEPDLN